MTKHEKFLHIIKNLNDRKICVEFKDNININYSNYIHLRHSFNDAKVLEIIKYIFNKQIPTSYTVAAPLRIDFVDFLYENLESIEFYYVETRLLHKKDTTYINCIFKYKDLIFNYSNNSLDLLYNDLSEITNNLELLNSFTETEIDTSGNIYMVVKKHGMYLLEEFKIPNEYENIFDNYNEGFEDVHTNIIEQIKTKSKGVIILDGKKGTGKTTYIRHLINNIKDKKVIFIPSYLNSNLTQTDFITFLIDFCKNSILVLEDCENILKSREISTNSAMSDLLNMSDGLMSDVLHIQFICTFNTDRTNIDEALLRPGRLIAEYNFTELTPDRVKYLCDKLNIPLVDSGYVSEIYNKKLVSKYSNKKTSVGFKLKETALGMA